VHNYLHPVPNSRILKLRFEPGLAIVHFNYLDSEQFIEKLNRYTSIGAQQALRQGHVVTRLGALARGIGEFGNRYIRASGWRDGWRGFYLSLFMAFYRIVAAAKIEELTTLGDREQVRARYRKEAEEILEAYGESPTGYEPTKEKTFIHDGKSASIRSPFRP
jgi:hypothetical protein